MFRHQVAEEDQFSLSVLRSAEITLFRGERQKKKAAQKSRLNNILTIAAVWSTLSFSSLLSICFFCLTSGHQSKEDVAAWHDP